MNFLAHIYLSFDDDDIAIGNFIADSIRGNRFEHLPPRVQQGIKLHRAIDTFTDAHPIPKRSSKRLHGNYGHYSRVIVDIYYDHFLAQGWHRYSEVPLREYAARFYDLLEERYPILPPAVHRMMPPMISEDWLYNYSKMEGIAKVLQGMDRRTRNRSNMKRAMRDLKEHYKAFGNEFSAFFDELIPFSLDAFRSLTKGPPTT